MVDSIRIETGLKRIAINDDPDRIIEFNPRDVIFAERFYDLIREFEKAEKEYLARAEELDADDAVDENGLPANAGGRLTLLKDICQFIREKIDLVFGEGTSRIAFGDALELEMFEQFFKGITPFIEASRKEKVVQYSRKGRSKTRK